MKSIAENKQKKIDFIMCFIVGAKLKVNTTFDNILTQRKDTHFLESILNMSHLEGILHFCRRESVRRNEKRVLRCTFRKD